MSATQPSTVGRSLRRLVVGVALGLCLVAVGATGATGTAGAQSPGDPPSTIVHEFVPPDPNEDVSFAATTLEGDLPAAVQTPSGLAVAPDPRRLPGDEHVYSGGTTDDGPDSSYEPDRDTRRPNVENYDDPFSPATVPFKRLRAYDWVEQDYSLHVRDKALKTVAVGGVVGVRDEPFYGDLSVDLMPDQPVRIPTVGPGARIVRMHANPSVPITVLRDGADNWFVRGEARLRIRLVMELAIPRATFGSDFADVSFATLAAGQALGGAHKSELSQVMQAIGISTSQRPHDVLAKMIAYYRSFGPSDESPTGKGDIYLDLALSKKGVCRHRAFAFLVTALGMGIPTRMVVNEAHAWVEVFDGNLWHRIDLGGAAANLDHQPDPAHPPYHPPPDPYEWPEHRDSGQDLAERSREKASSSAQGPGPANDADGGTSAPQPPGGGMLSETNDPSTPRSEVKVTSIDRDIRRGLPLHVQGEVSAAGVPCMHLRVDVLLVGPTMPQAAVVGSLSTDEQGRFDGAVVIPREFSLGDYDLVVSTPGDNRCPAGRTK